MISREKLKELLSYDEKTGIFIWKIANTRRIHVGDEAGRIKEGYIKIGINNKEYYAHRLAWLYIYGDWPNKFIDHINGNRSDNRIENLREVTQAENVRNSKMPKTNTSGIKGVRWNKKDGKWRAQCGIGGKMIYVGQYDSISEAKESVMRFREEHHKQFANHG